jgi:hypothetical protein
MTWNLKQIKQPVQHFCDLIVHLASTDALSPSFARLVHAVGNKEQLDIQMQQRQNAPENHFLHRIGGRLALANPLNLLRRQIVETPSRFVNGDPQGTFVFGIMRSCEISDLADSALANEVPKAEA